MILCGILIPFLGREYWLASYASGLAMAMSSVTVVENSILLGRYEPRFATVISKEIYSNKNLKKRGLFLAASC
jgi:P-type Cu+ transporter